MRSEQYPRLDLRRGDEGNDIGCCWSNMFVRENPLVLYLESLRVAWVCVGSVLPAIPRNLIQAH